MAKKRAKKKKTPKKVHNSKNKKVKKPAICEFC